MTGVNRSGLATGDALRRAKLAEQLDTSQKVDDAVPESDAPGQVGATGVAGAENVFEAGAASAVSRAAEVAGSEGASPTTRPDGPLGPPAGTVAEVESRFDTLAALAQNNPDRIADLRPKFAQIAGDVEPMISERQTQLGEVERSLGVKEKDLGWWQRNVGVGVPEDVKELRGQRDTLTTEIEDLKAFGAGSRIAMREGAPTDTTTPTAADHQQALDAKNAAVPQHGTGAAREGAISDLIGTQKGVERAADDAAVLARARAGDVGDYGKEVAWHQKNRFIDWLTLGKSARGDLYRSGIDQRSGARGDLGDMASVESSGNRMVRDQVTGLLQAESPEFAKTHERYQDLGVAKRSVDSTLSRVRDAQHNLREAERWSDRRDSLEDNPPDEYRWDGEQNVRNPNYDNWQRELTTAKNNANWAENGARSAIRDVNNALPSVEKNLRAVGERHVDLDAIDTRGLNLGDPFYNQHRSQRGDVLRYGTAMAGMRWLDSPVDRARDDISELKGRLEGHSYSINPQYGEHRDWVNNAIAERTQQLTPSE